MMSDNQVGCEWVSVSSGTLPQTVLSSDSVAVFKLRLKTFLYSQAFSSFSAH